MANLERVVAGIAVVLLAGCATRSAAPVDEPVAGAAPLAVAQQPVTLKTPTGGISGTLELPAARTPVPVAFIIAGSGPTDRNGNSPAIPGANNSLKMLADGLAARGIASVRYDKRGIAASRAAMSGEEDLRFNHFIEDAVAWVKQLRADKRFSTVTSIGHSEGSLIGMIAAREAGADAYVSLEGTGRKAADILIIQGTTDIQTSMEDAKLLATANPKGRFVTIEGMNHILKEVSGDRMAQLPKYGDSTLVVVPKLIDEVGSFIRPVPKRVVAHDSWFGPDKIKHFFISAFIESLAFSGLQASGAGRGAAFAGAIATTAAFAFGREVHDRRTKGIFSIPDLTWDAAGAGAALLVLQSTQR